MNYLKVISERYLTSDKSITFNNSYLEAMKYYEIENNYIYGAKTGFIDEAGLCLSSIAKINGIEYMLVSTNADYETREPYHILDAINIYETRCLNIIKNIILVLII